MKKNNRKFKFWLLVVLATMLVVVAACGASQPVEVVSSATYVLENSDGVVATIVWDGTDWSCTTEPSVEGVPCEQLVGSQTLFFYGIQRIAKEELTAGVSVGTLLPQDNWTMK